MRHLSNCFSVVKQYNNTLYSVPFVNISVVFHSDGWSDPRPKLWAIQTILAAPLPQDQSRRQPLMQSRQVYGTCFIHDPCKLKWEVIKPYLDLHEQPTHWNASPFSKILIKKLDFSSSSKQARTANKTLPRSSHSSIGRILHKLKLMDFFN